MSNTSKSVQVTKDLEVSIISAGPGYGLNDPVWAINWFDVKSKWLYDFYNLLVIRHVINVGGRPHFKGKLVKRLIGESEYEREVLLIVNYPQPTSFLNMLMNKKFQLKSIIREMAVKDFTFGFMKRVDDGEPPKVRGKYDGKLIYLVHHFKNNHKLIDTPSIKEFAASRDIFTHFSGVKSALVGRKKSKGKLKTAPFLMDSMLIFGAFEVSQFDDFISSSFYQDFISQNQNNYIGLFKREF